MDVCRSLIHISLAFSLGTPMLPVQGSGTPGPSVILHGAACAIQYSLGETVNRPPSIRPPETTSQPEDSYTRPADFSPISQIAVRLEGREALILHGAIGQLDGKPVTYHFAEKEAGSVPSNPNKSSYQLRSSTPEIPSIQCVIEAHDQGRTTTIALTAKQALPDISLLAHTPIRMLPVRLKQPEKDRIIQSAIGPSMSALIDGLYDARHDWAYELKGQFTCQPGLEGTDVMMTLPTPHEQTQTIMKVISHKDHVKSALELPPEEITGRLPRGEAPAGWTSCIPGTETPGTEISRIASWLVTNMKSSRPLLIQTDNHDPQLHQRITELSMTSEPCGNNEGTITPSWMGPQGLPGTWIHIRAFAHLLMMHYWAQGLVGHLDLGPIVLGDPVPFQQARLWASLMGLSGATLLTCGPVDAWPANRLELLTKISPPASIRAVDLYRYASDPRPRLWNLKVATDFGRWDILGVFNPTPQSTRTKVRLDRLGLGSQTGQSFAVMDVWSGRLVAATDQSFEIDVPPTGCRVVAIKALNKDRPTLLGSNRHITCGGIDLHGIYFDESTFTLRGRSDLIGHSPYELWLFMPQGDNSVEITGVDAEIESLIRQDGPLQIVTLQSDTDRSINWAIAFQRATASPFEPPVPPRRLEARQNTRGVRLAWNSIDDRAVFYRIYRDGKPLADIEESVFQDETAVYNRTYLYKVTAIDWAGRESKPSTEIAHRTPIPASVYLSQLLPLSVDQDHYELGIDMTMMGKPLRIAGRRYERGLGTHADAHIRYYLGGGFDSFNGEIGIDDEVGDGSATVKVLGDGQELYTAKTPSAGKPASAFRVSVKDMMIIELVVIDDNDDSHNDHVDWVNPRLEAARVEDLTTISPSP